MKTKSILIFFQFFLILTTLANEKIKLVADEWCPYNCSEKSEKMGYMVEIAKKVFESKNIQLEYRTLNWSRAILDARSGKINGIIGAYKSDAEDFVFPSTHLGESLEVFVVKKDHEWKYSGIKSLDEVTLGVIRDYSYGQNIDSYIALNKTNFQRIQIVSGDMPLERNIRKLLNNRISAVIANEAVLKWLMKRKPYLKDKIKIAGQRFTSTKVYIAFSPKNRKQSQRYAQILSDGIEKLKESGELEEILKKYGISIESFK
ncbi:ABC transporter substrate-binding protein [Halobacteriovorax sp. HLS]|uniref:substrate-binding periplasmic protein n=1 Tax=Halobacteriovorax sp. HLS TaxID=2234000 RepID=UPI000FD8BB7B|nr:transporter substrate-binding domain-containing protein [Halobacteriovorax sp. HLS]